MNNGRGESGERRESHSVTLQWCLNDQSKTTALKLQKRDQNARAVSCVDRVRVDDLHFAVGLKR